jgi:hypothetical protein
MNEYFQTTRKDRILARCAGGCLGGSVLLGVGAVFVIGFMAGPISMISQHPVATAAALFVACAFCASAWAVTQLGRDRTSIEPLRLWQRSLICNFLVVATIVVAFGAGLGFLLSIMELVAIVLHLVAIVIHRAPAYDV